MLTEPRPGPVLGPAHLDDTWLLHGALKADRTRGIGLTGGVVQLGARHSG